MTVFSLMDFLQLGHSGISSISTLRIFSFCSTQPRRHCSWNMCEQSVWIRATWWSLKSSKQMAQESCISILGLGLMLMMLTMLTLLSMLLSCGIGFTFEGDDYKPLKNSLLPEPTLESSWSDSSLSIA